MKNRGRPGRNKIADWPSSVNFHRIPMMKTLFVPMAVALHFAAGPLMAQVSPKPEVPKEKPETPKPEDKEPKRSEIWEATLPGGDYAVAVDRITSVSRHSYLLDGALIVDEVTIDTEGQALARFYHITPVGTTGTAGVTKGSVEEPAKRLFDTPQQRVGVDLEHMVIKKYPDTTHARSIEYRIDTTETLTKLFNSAKTAWQSGEAGQFKAGVK